MKNIKKYMMSILLAVTALGVASNSFAETWVFAEWSPQERADVMDNHRLSSEARFTNFRKIVAARQLIQLGSIASYIVEQVKIKNPEIAELLNKAFTLMGNQVQERKDFSDQVISKLAESISTQQREKDFAELLTKAIQEYAEQKLAWERLEAEKQK